MWGKLLEKMEGKNGRKSCQTLGKSLSLAFGSGNFIVVRNFFATFPSSSWPSCTYLLFG